MDGPLPWAGERYALGGMMPDRRREDEGSSNSDCKQEEEA